MKIKLLSVTGFVLAMLILTGFYLSTSFSKVEARDTNSKAYGPFPKGSESQNTVTVYSYLQPQTGDLKLVIGYRSKNAANIQYGYKICLMNQDGSKRTCPADLSRTGSIADTQNYSEGKSFTTNFSGLGNLAKSKMKVCFQMTTYVENGAERCKGKACQETCR